jgi:hypothetical protein
MNALHAPAIETDKPPRPTAIAAEPATRSAPRIAQDGAGDDIDGEGRRCHDNGWPDEPEWTTNIKGMHVTIVRMADPVTTPTRDHPSERLDQKQKIAENAGPNPTSGYRGEGPTSNRKL